MSTCKNKGWINNLLTQTSKHIQGCHNPQQFYIIHDAQENDALKNNSRITISLKTYIVQTTHHAKFAKDKWSFIGIVSECIFQVIEYWC
jgi:hypothetical protein